MKSLPPACPLTISNSSLLLVMQAGKGWTAPVVVEQALQMKSSQFLEFVLMLGHHLCIQFWQLRQRIKYAPTPFIHTPHGSLIDTVFDLETSCLK